MRRSKRNIKKFHTFKTLSLLQRLHLYQYLYGRGYIRNTKSTSGGGRKGKRDDKNLNSNAHFVKENGSFTADHK